MNAPGGIVPMFSPPDAVKQLREQLRSRENEENAGIKIYAGKAGRPKC